MNNVTQQDLEYIKDLLSKYDYTIIGGDNYIRCYSYQQGIKSDKEWDKIYETITNKFGKRLMEVYHSTCTYHLDFKIYLRNKQMLREEKIKRILF